MIELLAALAIWKITTMIVEYDGPFEVFERARDFTRQYRGVNLDCFFCLSTLVAIPFALYFASGLRAVIYWAGLAGAAALVNEVISESP